MTYNFEDHLHNYAVWTSARAVQRNFYDTISIKSAIEKTKLRDLIVTHNVFSEDEFDAFHRETARLIMDSLKSTNVGLEDKATYGRAAKIIAIYIKTIAVIRYSGNDNLSKVAHPPIDRILLSNAHKEHSDLGLNKISWTKLTEQEYFDLIRKLRTLKFDKFWELEQYWSPTQNDSKEFVTI